MSDYVDTVDIEGTQYDIQDTATKQTADENAQEIESIKTGNDYSLSEINTGKKWINNKPIYRKVISYPQAIPAGRIEIPTGINNIELMINIDSLIIEPNNFIWFRPLLNRTLLVMRNIFFQYTGAVIVVDGIAEIPSYTQNYFILEYTKTTD